MIKKVAITGPESTGKSELIAKLAKQYETIYVPDYSRIHMEALQGEYHQADVVEIAKRIMALEKIMLPSANGILFSDNDLINIKVWLQFYNWAVPEWLDDAILEHKPDLYLLGDIDIPWVADEQRKNPNDRKELFARFETELSRIGSDYHIISGTGEQRYKNAIAFVDDWLRRQ